MFIRRTTVKSRKDGTKYFTYRIVESRRTEKGVSQHTLLNLGADFSLPREQWPVLTGRIQDIISGQKSIFKLPSDIEKMAEKYASLIIILQKQEDNARGNSGDILEVDIDSLEALQPRSIGAEYISLEALRSLKIEQLLENKGFTGPQIAAAVGSIIGRMCRPGSEIATHRWLQEDSGLGELLDYDFGKMSQYALYRISDKLYHHKKDIEDHLFAQEKQLFGFKETITLYDLTNTYFEGTCQGNELAERGHSKEKRSDCPLVTLALVLDASGFPKHSQVFKGNACEANTLEQMINSLRSQKLGSIFEHEKPTIVMDAGIATQENIDWLIAHGFNYLVVSRQRHREFNEQEAVVVKEDKGCSVKAHKVTDQDTGETLLYCHSTQREKKERAIEDRFVTKFDEDLRKLEQGLHKKGCLKNYDKILEKIGRLRQKYQRASSRFTISVEKDEKGDNATRITWKQEPKQGSKSSLPGVYCLRTSLSSWDEETLWKTYTMLTDLESVFRSLKSELGLRPIYHQNPERVSAHLFITLIAYHIVHSIRYRLQKHDIHSSWSTIRDQIAGQCRITISMRGKNEEMVYVRKSTRAEARQRVIYDALGLPGQPGETIKTIMPIK